MYTHQKKKKKKQSTWTFTALERHGRMVRLPNSSTKQTHCAIQKYITKVSASNIKKSTKKKKKKRSINIQLHRIRNSKLTWPVGPLFILNLERFTPLELMLLTNNWPWSLSPYAPIIPHETPKPALSPLTVLAILPPANIFITNWSSGDIWKWLFTSLFMANCSLGDPLIWVFTLPNISSSSSIAT